MALLNGMNETIMAMVDLIMWYVPIGLIFLISNKIMSMGDDMGSVWKALGLFIVTTISSLVIHGFIVVPALYFLEKASKISNDIVFRSLRHFFQFEQ